MNYRILFCLITVFTFQSINAQLSNVDEEKLSVLLVEIVNTLRVEKQKPILKRHKDLAKAAKLHANYISEKGKLNHTQMGTPFPKPKDRVDHFNKSFTTIGENILYTKPLRKSLDETGLKRLAFEIFRSWKGSPGHFANMISDSFSYGDFGFTYNKKSKQVFAVQVFAKQGYVIDGQLSDNAFGVLPTDFACVDLISNTSNIIVNIGNAVHIENGEVFLRHHNLKTMKEIFETKSDGLAVDLVTRDQLLCGEDSRLDASIIYDGVMLAPIYRDEMFNSNTAKNPNRLIVSLGKIPENLLGENLSPNIIIIKDGKKCSYTVPANIPSRKYNLKPIAPEIFNPEIALKTQGVNGIYEVSFDFKSGEITPIKNPILSIDENKIEHIEIKSFTSVDGNENSNEKLHKGRADYIVRFLNRNLNVAFTSTTIHAKENWELCFYQLELLGLEDDFGQDKEKIKNYIKNNKNDTWERALSNQRKSKAIVYLNGSWEEHDPNHLNYNLRDALLNNNYKLANKVLAEMYLKENSNLFLNEEFVLDKLFDKKELVQNVSALLLKNIDSYDTDNIVFFVRNWLTKSDVLSKEAQKNLLNLYTITTRRLLRYWDSSAENLSKVMHPEKVEELFDNYKNQEEVNPLFLNFHMSSIEYYGQINYSPEIRISFDFISNYFKNVSKSVEDDTALSLFFNTYSMYHMTVENLKERFDEDKLDEEAAFILAKTVVASQEIFEGETFLNIHKKAISFNKKRWCNWIDLDFQNLRDDAIKNVYCNTCED